MILANPLFFSIVICISTQSFKESRWDISMTFLKYILIISKIRINPSIFSSSNAVPGSSSINMSAFGKEDTLNSDNRIAIAAIVFSAPEPISIGLGLCRGCLMKISSLFPLLSKNTSKSTMFARILAISWLITGIRFLMIS